MENNKEFAELFILLLLTPLYLLISLAEYKLIKKANGRAWMAWLPFFGYSETLRITGRPQWWMAMLLIPIVNVFYSIGMLVDLSNSFGKTEFKHHAMAVLAPWAYFLYLGFNKNVTYLGTWDQLPKRKNTQTQEWRDSILFAVLAATLIRWMIMELYMIPTPSMEKSLLVGDYLFVSKMHYGPRTPQTPLQLPFTHQHMWGSQTIPSYLDWIQLPMFRLPGFQRVERGDAVVFNWPADRDHPADLRTHYIKRCIGVPGDTLKIVNRQVMINGKAAENPAKLQWQYALITNEEIDMRAFKRYGVMTHDVQFDPSYGMVGYRKRPDGKLEYFAFLQPSVAEKMKADGLIQNYYPINFDDPQMMTALFPFNKVSTGWTVDKFGPLWIPQKGKTIPVNFITMLTYGSTIVDYEGLKNVELREVKSTIQTHDEITDLKLFIDGKEVKEYTFQKDYYFMMGDNRHNSADSRFWGFVPDDHIVGKALFILMSFDNDRSGFKSIRWERMFKWIH